MSCGECLAAACGVPGACGDLILVVSRGFDAHFAVHCLLLPVWGLLPHLMSLRGQWRLRLRLPDLLIRAIWAAGRRLLREPHRLVKEDPFLVGSRQDSVEDVHPKR